MSFINILVIRVPPIRVPFAWEHQSKLRYKCRNLRLQMRNDTKSVHTQLIWIIKQQFNKILKLGKNSISSGLNIPTSLNLKYPTFMQSNFLHSISYFGQLLTHLIHLYVSRKKLHQHLDLLYLTILVFIMNGIFRST